MKVKLLRKIQKHILAEPKRYDQSFWLETDSACLINRYKDEGEIPKCGTVGCIAGWAATLSQKRPIRKWKAWHRRRAIELLGLDDDQAERLFGLPEDWPYEFADDYFDGDRVHRAKVAARRIDHFIKTKGKE